jgi:hypothetical protein
LPVTRAALETILTRSASGEFQTSLHDRVLAGVCDFRAKTATGTLLAFLSTNTAGKLSEARFALNEIGATNVAALLSQTISDLQRTSAARREAALLLILQSKLIAVGDYLDRKIAQYALSTQTRRAPVRPLRRVE